MNPLWEHEPEHPLLPLPTEAEVAAILARPGGEAELAQLIEERRAALQRSLDDPLRYEPEPWFWGEVRRLLAERWRTVIILGGNRSGKSRVCGKLVMESVVNHPGTRVLCISEDETASMETQQSIIWHYLPPEYKALNGRRDPARVYYINYSEANKFSERRLVLPNQSRVLFATYNEEPDQYEGMMWGHPLDWVVSWWADENLRLAWLKMLVRRGRFQPGTGLWSYTPVRGMTPTIKEAVGEAPQTLKALPARLLPDRVNVPGLAPGTMPFIQAPHLADARVIYFFSELSPFGPGPNGTGKPFAQSVAEDCAGKPSEYVKRIAYGYTEDTVGRAFPLFCSVHVVNPEQVPRVGTRYMFTDPAGARNWFTIWVLVTPDEPPRLFVYRDWPDEQTYGEWAVPTERAATAESRKGWDGDPGPAQTCLGFGVAQYKQLWLRLEAGELIEERYIDPRAGRNAIIAEKGGTCLLEELEAEQRDERGEVVGPRMAFTPASGVDVQEGVAAINDLLYFDRTRPVDWIRNSPRLYVSSACRQVIWALANYTGRAGETGACKDVVDVLRYAAMANLEHLDPEREWVRVPVHV